MGFDLTIVLTSLAACESTSAMRAEIYVTVSSKSWFYLCLSKLERYT